MPSQLGLWPQPRPVAHLRWSHSRDRRLRECPRQYHFYYYASAGGHRAEAPPACREAYRLKHLRSRFMWVGEVVHGLVEAALRQWQAGAPVAAEALVERGLRRLQQGIAESAQGLHGARPGAACGLVEHAYGEPVTAADWEALHERLRRCVHNFVALPLAAEVRQLPPWRWLALEGHGQFALEGASVLVRPDLAFRDAAGHVVLVDWKSGGRSDDGHLQLGVYALFAERTWGLGGAPAQGRLEYLDGHTSADVFAIGTAELAAAEAHVRASVRRMQALAAAAAAGPPDAAHFAPAPQPRRCGRCSFRRLCDAAAPQLTGGPPAAISGGDVGIPTGR